MKLNDYGFTIGLSPKLMKADQVERWQDGHIPFELHHQVFFRYNGEVFATLMISTQKLTGSVINGMVTMNHLGGWREVTFTKPAKCADIRPVLYPVIIDVIKGEGSQFEHPIEDIVQAMRKSIDA